MNTKQKQKKKNNVATPKALHPNRILQLPYLYGITFAALLWLLLVLFESDFLFRTQELSLWLPTSVFLKERLLVPGGFLTYLATFLTQFNYYPWLGALITVALLFGIQMLSQKIFGIPAKYALVALLPAVLLVCCNMEIGYWIFQIKTQGYLYMAVLGFLFLLLGLWGYQKTPKKIQGVYIAVWTVVGYPLLGYYALLACATMILRAFTQLRKGERITVMLLGLLCIVAVPAIYYSFYNQTRFSRMYTAALPAYEFIARDLRTWIPYSLLSLYPLVTVFLFRKQTNENPKNRKNFFLFQGVGTIVLASLLLLFWFRDPNFRAEIKMNAAMEKLEWRKVLDIAKAQKESPTRLMVLNKNLALLKLGTVGDEMFHYLDGGAEPASPVEIRLMQVGGKMLYYHYARFNFCYRWCLEDGVEYGWKVEYLKFLVKTSLLSGEPQLAQKYINTLKKTLFYKDWAKKYEQFVQEPERIQKDREFAGILPLYCYDDQLDGDNSLVEIYLLNYFAHSYSPKSTPMFDEASLMCALTLKDIPTFWQCFFRYANSHKKDRMKTHYQEAALLYGNLEKTVDISHMPFDKSVKLRFQDFMKFARDHAVGANVEKDEKVKKLFYDRFGDTFYYFYFFIRDVKSY